MMFDLSDLDCLIKFLAIIDEQVCDLSEVGDEWFGNDSTLDKIIRDVYYEEEVYDDYNVLFVHL